MKKDSLCRELKEDLAKVIQISGGHHFGGNIQANVDNILREIK